MFDFTEIGLDNRDKRVYEALLEWPQASLRQLADITGINRGSVYESIKQLVAAGLVGSVQSGKQQRYVAQDPKLLIELLRERQRKAEQAEIQAGSYIEQLARTNQQEQATAVPFAVYYEDDEGVAAILRDVLKTMRESADTTYHAISSKSVRQYLYTNFPNFTRQRIEAGIAVSVIAIGSGGAQDELSHRRWMDMGKGHDPNCYTIIYGPKTAFISMNEQNVLTGIVIDNPGITEVQREQFHRLWDTLDG